MGFDWRILSGFKDDLFAGAGLSGRFDTTPRWLEIEVTDQPDIEPSTLAEVKRFLSVSHSDHDQMIRGYITQAMKNVEEFTGRAIATQEITAYWKLVWDYVWLPRPPHISITSVTEIEDDGTQNTISSSDYDTFGNNELKLEFDESFGNQLKVVYQAGYGTTIDDLPRWAKTAVEWQVYLYYKKNQEVAVDASSGLALPAYDAAKNHIFVLPE